MLSAENGYLQHYDREHLLGTAGANDLTVRMLVPMGAYINRGQPIARIWTASGDAGDLEAASRGIRGAFAIGNERTMAADLPLGIRQIADIGIKALSPGINDS